jgi:hypothetical protein
VELTDTESDEVIWAEHYNELSNDLFELIDRIATQIVEKTSPQVRQAELKRANFKRPENMDAYDYVLQAIDLMYRLNVDDFMKAQEYFEKSIRLEPTFAKAYALYAKWYGLKFGQGWSTNPDSDRNETDRWPARLYVSMVPMDFRSLFVGIIDRICFEIMTKP